MDNIQEFLRPVYGHQNLFHQFLGSLNKQSLHHAWLLSGPQGIGKSYAASVLARFLLRHPKEPYPTILPKEEVDTIFHQVQNGTHPDFFLLQKGEDTLSHSKTFITVDAIRHVTQKLQQTSVYGGWKVVLVDAVDDMNEKAQNAFLKTLEEPTACTVFFLIHHGIGSLAPTLRSRCHEIKMRPLSSTDMEAFLKENPVPLTKQEIDCAQAISEGRLGIFEQLVHFQGLALLDQIIEALLEVLTRRNPPYPKSFHLSEFIGKEEETQESFFYYLITWYLQTITRRLATQDRTPLSGTKEEQNPLPWEMLSLESWLQAQEEVLKLLKEGSALKTELKQRILNCFSALNTDRYV